MKIFSHILTLTSMLGLPPAAWASGLEWKTVEVSLKGEATQAKLTAAFPFRNTGSSEVRITAVESTCDCITGKTQKETYQPGEAGEIRAELNAAMLSGKQTRTLKVVTNAPDAAPTVLTVEVEMLERVVLSSRFLYWTPDGLADEKQVDIAIRAPDMVKLSGFESNNSYFDVQLEPGAAPGQHRLRVRPRGLELGQASVIRLAVQVGDRRQTYLVYAAVNAKAPVR